jgi:hypothetical protein
LSTSFQRPFFFEKKIDYFFLLRKTHCCSMSSNSADDDDVADDAIAAPADDNGDDDASNSSSAGSSALSVGDFLLDALTSGRMRSAAHQRRGARGVARIGLFLRRVDAGLKRDGDSVGDRIAMVGFLLVFPPMTLAAVVWAALMFAESKFYAGTPPAPICRCVCRLYLPRDHAHHAAAGGFFVGAFFVPFFS